MYLTKICRKYPFPCLLLLIFLTLTAMKFYRHYISHENSINHWLASFPSTPKKFQSNNLSVPTYSLALRQEIFGNTLDTDSSKTIKTFYNKTLQPPGVILNLKGGIGNQLFQYACSYALARDLEWPLYIFHAPTPISPAATRGFQPRQREFALDQFQIPLDNIIDSSTKNPVGIRYQNDRQFLERTFLNRKDIDKQFVSLGGASYCQSIEYWRDYQEEIKAMFKPHKWAVNRQKLEQIINKIENSGESVVVHVRRGDFTVAQGFHVPLTYQRHAIRKMINLLHERDKRKPVFFVFSDDIRYVKEKLKDFGERYELVFVSEKVPNSTSIEEFYLMTLCKHIILPNSTYSWWAAYLMKNLEKIVIASAFNPTFMGAVVSKRDWFLQEQFGKIYHPKEWIIIDPFTGGFVTNS